VLNERGVHEAILDIAGMAVTVRGVMVDDVPHIGSAWIIA
jgi:hypothetical protein